MSLNNAVFCSKSSSRPVPGCHRGSKHHIETKKLARTNFLFWSIFWQGGPYAPPPWLIGLRGIKEAKTMTLHPLQAVRTEFLTDQDMSNPLNSRFICQSFVRLRIFTKFGIKLKDNDRHELTQPNHPMKIPFQF